MTREELKNRWEQRDVLAYATIALFGGAVLGIAGVFLTYKGVQTVGTGIVAGAVMVFLADALLYRRYLWAGWFTIFSLVELVALYGMLR